MAAIVEPEEGLDLKKFLQAVKHQLPSYAVPLFVRVVEKVDLTGMVNYDNTVKLNATAFVILFIFSCLALQYVQNDSLRLNNFGVKCCLRRFRHFQAQETSATA